MPFVSITRLRLRTPWYLPAFFFQTIPVFVQIKRAPGNLAVDTLQDAKLAFWTRSVWTDQASMHAFMLSGAHRKAMPKLAGWCDEASGVNWVQDAATLPDWNEAHRRLVAGGRKVRVKYPTAAHEALEVPPPRV